MEKSCPFRTLGYITVTKRCTYLPSLVWIQQWCMLSLIKHSTILLVTFVQSYVNKKHILEQTFVKFFFIILKNRCCSIGQSFQYKTAIEALRLTQCYSQFPVNLHSVCCNFWLLHSNYYLAPPQVQKLQRSFIICSKWWQKGLQSPLHAMALLRTIL